MSKNGQIRIVIADDHEMVAQGLKLLIERIDPEIQVVGTAVDGCDAVRVCAEIQPDLVLMDVRMPEMDGVEAVKELHRSLPEIRVLMLTTFDDDEYVIGALRNGAAGYLLKDMPGDELVQAIRSVDKGCTLMSPSVMAKVLQRFSTDVEEEAEVEAVNQSSHVKAAGGAREALAPREREILKLLAEGLENPEIAARLHISEGTVRNYVSKIYEKLNIHGRAQAVLYVMNNPER